MFAHLFAAFRSADRDSTPSSRNERDLALLDLRDRSDAQEHEARRIETMLFFDTELLAAAKKRASSRLALPKMLLASIVGALLVLSPYRAQAEGDAEEPTTSSTSSDSPTEETTLQEQMEAWLESMGLLGEDSGDPAEGDD